MGAQSRCIFVYSIVVIISEVVIGVNRHFFLTAEDVDWDYAPGGLNRVDFRQRDANVFLQNGPNRIGHVYKKAIYKLYTDDSYSEEIPSPGWIGMLGPIIRAEVDDTILVHFKNLASRPYSVHPHGVLYTKSSEGALYNDRTNGSDKVDDSVAPGQSHTYTWDIPVGFSPSDDDPNCVTWAYHSHVDPEKDTNSGLIGVLLTCKKGVLNNDNTRNDIDKEFALLFKIFDENLSWYIGDNTEKCGDPLACQILLLAEEEDFAESNLMHSINGYLYGNQPPFEACLGDSTVWYVVGMGSNVDLHTVFFHGQTLMYNHRRSDVLYLIPASFRTALIVPENPARWLINCQVNDHYTAGMQAFFDVTTCGKTQPTETLNGITRRYYIAAEEVEWDYAPSGLNKYDGGTLLDYGSASKKFFEKGNATIGGVYKKALFIEYTDSTFVTKMSRTDGQAHLGFLGPVIRAEIGDTIEVMFRNLASRPYSIQPHGVFYNKSNEGAQYFDNGTETSYTVAVGPNEVRTYYWTVPSHVGPAPDDPDCIVYHYISGVDPVRDSNSGLVGPMLICKSDSLDTDSKQKDIDHEFFVQLSVTDENLSWYIEDNIQMYCGDPACVDKNDDEFMETNLMHGINGLLYGNLDGLTMCVADRVAWHVLGLGTEVDIHSLTFNGQTVSMTGNRVQSVSILPGTFKTLHMTPDNVGTWSIACQTNLHFTTGMKAQFVVNDCSKSIDKTPSTGTKRLYYIAAQEVNWKYEPENVIDGPVMTMVVYREYTDVTFDTEKTRDSSEAHLGLLGPIIRVEVGDIVEVVFQNKASRPFSLHAHGLMYDKLNEGFLYQDGTSTKVDDAVSPGGYHVYKWTVPERSGPDKHDPNCITWPYFSATNPVRDTETGLIGPIIVCRKGTLDRHGKRSDVDKEFVLFFSVMTEENNWFGTGNSLEYVVNGYINGNAKGFLMNMYDKVAWYVISFGSEEDIHSIHFHGQTMIHKDGQSHRVDVIDVFPGSSDTAEMVADNPGTWLLHCHVNDHLRNGMETTFTVNEAGGLSRDQLIMISILSSIAGIVLIVVIYIVCTKKTPFFQKKAGEKSPPTLQEAGLT